MKNLLILSLFILTSCDFVKGVIGANSSVDDTFNNPTSTGNSFSISFPSNNRNTFVDDESAIRTVTFNQNNVDYIECSEDSGSTYFNCSGTNFTWNASNYAATHLVRVRYNDGEEFNTSFTPSSSLSGKSFVSCTHTISANESVTTFNGRTFGTGDIVCFDDGVSISGTVGHTLDANSLTYIVRDGDTATITSTVSGEIISTSTYGNFKVVGLTITGSSNSAKGIRVDTNGFIADDINISMAGNVAYGIEFASVNSNSQILNSDITTTDTASSYAIYAQNTPVEIINSTITAGYQAVFFWRTSTNTQSLTATNSTFKITKTDGTADDPGVINTFSNNASNYSDLSFSSCTIESSSGPAIKVSGGLGTNQIYLTDTTVKSNTSYSIAGPGIRYDSSNSGDTVTFDSDSLFCEESGAASGFDEIVDDSVSSMAAFTVTNMSAHTNNTDIGTCN